MKLPKFRLDPIQSEILRDVIPKGRYIAVLFIIITVLSSISVASAPIVLAKTIQFSGTIDKWQITFGCLFFAFCMGFGKISQDIKLVLSNSLEQGVRISANNRILSTLLKANGTLFIENNSTKISSILGNFHQSNKMYLQLSLIALFGGVADIVFSILVIWGHVSVILAIFVAIYGTSIIGVTLYTNRETGKYLKSAQWNTIASQNIFGNIIANALTIKVFQRLRWALEMYEHRNISSKQAWKSFYFVRLKFGGLQALLLFIQYGSVLIIAIWTQPKETYVYSLVAVGMVLAQLNRPFELIGTSLRDLAVARSLAEPMQILLDTYSLQPTAADSYIQFSVSKPNIRIENLSFLYDSRKDAIFEGLFAEFYPGQLNFIVGPSGSGKSTLTHILLGLITNYQGSLTVNGVELGKVELQEYLPNVGYVAQESVLLNLSIRENVTLGRSVSDEDVCVALAKANLLTRVSALPGGLDYCVGERGQMLSGGERQRVAIARALLGKPSLLILDEPSSALDEAAEMEIFEELRRISGDVTIVAVTHRRGAIRERDNLLDLDTCAKSPFV